MDERAQSIFQTDWWCDASDPGQWDKVECSISGGASAELIYVPKKKYGFLEVGMPYLARTMAPTIRTPGSKYTTQLTGEVGLIGAMMQALPKFDYFWYTIPPESQLELAFNLAGFLTEGQYTFRRPPHGENEDFWAAMDRKTRNHVKVGLKEFEIQSHKNIERFARMSKALIASKSWVNKIDYEAIGRIFDACVSRDQAIVLSAVDEYGHDVAAAVLIWDQQFLYYWLSARDPDSARGSANSALIWKAIQIADEKRLTFDLDGYASPASGAFYSKFGLRPYRRTHITRQTTLAKWAANSRLLIKATTPAGFKSKVMGLLRAPASAVGKPNFER